MNFLFTIAMLTLSKSSETFSTDYLSGGRTGPNSIFKGVKQQTSHLVRYSLSFSRTTNSKHQNGNHNGALFLSSTSCATTTSR